MMNILITAPYNESGLKTLENSIGKVIYKPWKINGRAYREEELMALLQTTGTNALITEHDTVSEKVIQAFPHLKFIGVCRGTPSNVDVKAASCLNIPVFYTPARNAQAVAEMFIANVVTFMRNTIAAAEWLQNEKWESGAHDSYLQFKGNELAGKTIGLVGFGAIGQCIAHLINNFPCRVQFYDPFLDAYDEHYKKTSIEDIFATSDVVSIHLPANKQTEGAINKRLLSLMKPEAIFVNTSRAMVVNREDLLHILEDKKIRGAILDVFDQEPPDETDYKIIHLSNVLATPHIAGATFEVEDHHVEIMNKNLLNWYVEHKENESFVSNGKDLAKTV